MTGEREAAPRRRDLEFLLYEVLDAETMCAWPRYAEHDRAGFDAALDSARRLAARDFAPHYQRSDRQEPVVVDGRVRLIPEIKTALDRFAEAGFLAAHHEPEHGGIALPWLLSQACFCHFQAANIATAAYPFLTVAAANLIRACGSPRQRELYLPPLLDGRWFATMALSEPQAGSALADVATRADVLGRGAYAIRGVKQWVSGGEHEISENIVHLLLARVRGAPPGIAGLSLFIVPRYRAETSGRVDNDVRLIGLNHKMGYRGTVNAVLGFGEHGACVGDIVGAPGEGLKILFRMMNEARIGVALGAVMLGYAGFRYALSYARERSQGRRPGAKDPKLPPLPLTAHADVKRLLLAAKAYSEGNLLLCLHAASLVDLARDGPRPETRENAALELEVLTPLLKTWCSETGLKANDHAIQILGGYGYCRDHPVEQYYRDNRLNPIHEGANAIQALDLLGRKVPLAGGRALMRLLTRMRGTLRETRGLIDDELRTELRLRLDRLDSLLAKLESARRGCGPEPLLAHAGAFAELLGRLSLAWAWLWQGGVARRRLLDGAPLTAADLSFYRGKLTAMQYVFRWELPQTDALIAGLENLDTIALDADADTL